VSAFSCRIGGEVRGFDPEKYIDRKEVKKMDTFIQFAIAASREAVADSGLRIDADNSERVGVYIGSGIGACRCSKRPTRPCSRRGRARSRRFSSRA